MINLLTNKFFLIGIAAVAFFAMQMLALNSAYNAGVEAEQAKTRQAIIDQMKERSETDAEIRDMDIPELCGLLGGSMSDDGECL